HALEVSGPHVQILDSLGAALLRSGRSREAVPYLRQLVEQHPGHHSGRFNLALALLELNQCDEGRAELEEVLRIAPRNARAEYTLGRLDYLSGDLDGATQHLQEAVRIEP